MNGKIQTFTNKIDCGCMLIKVFSLQLIIDFRFECYFVYGVLDSWIISNITQYRVHKTIFGFILHEDSKKLFKKLSLATLSLTWMWPPFNENDSLLWKCNF